MPFANSEKTMRKKPTKIEDELELGNYPRDRQALIEEYEIILADNPGHLVVADAVWKMLEEFGK